MTQPELAAAILSRRGSVQEEPLRSRHAGACVRAAVEVERHLTAPRRIVRRLDGPAGVLLARDAVDDRGEPRIDGQKLADFAQRLGRTANELSAGDSLLAPLGPSTPCRRWPRRPGPHRRRRTGCSRSPPPSRETPRSRAGLSSIRAAWRPTGRSGSRCRPSRAPTPSTPTRSGGAWPDAIPRRRPCPTGPSSTPCSETRQRPAVEVRSARRGARLPLPATQLPHDRSSTSYTHVSGGAPRVAEGKAAEWGDPDASTSGCCAP